MALYQIFVLSWNAEMSKLVWDHTNLYADTNKSS